MMQRSIAETMKIVNHRKKLSDGQQLIAAQRAVTQTMQGTMNETEDEIE